VRLDSQPCVNHSLSNVSQPSEARSQRQVVKMGVDERGLNWKQDVAVHASFFCSSSHCWKEESALIVTEDWV
jgi:hypothetical protein